MSSAFRYILIILFMLSIAAISHAEEKKSDPWLGKDKFEHFGYSAFLSGCTCTVAHRHFEYRSEKSLSIGIGFTVSLGAVKEFIDSKTPNHTASYKDFTWDIAGALTGALIVSLAK